MDSNALKSYLVKLGFQIENSELQQFTSTLKNLTSTIESHTAGMADNYTKAGLKIVATLGSISSAVVAMAASVADADMDYQLFSQRMYMSAETAKEFKLATDALGKSLNEIAWNEELRNQYFQLRDDVKAMKIPDQLGFKQNLKDLRDIGFQWTRVKNEAKLSMEWITYHLFRLNKGEIKDFQTWMHDLNKNIMEQMPIWTAKVADFVNIFLEFGKKGVLQPIKDLYDNFKKLWDLLSQEDKEKLLAGGILGAIAVAFAAGGPFAKALIIVTLLSAGFIDFYDAIEGKETLLPIEAWQAFAAVVDAVGKSILATYLVVKNVFKPAGWFFGMGAAAGATVAQSIWGETPFGDKKLAESMRKGFKEQFFEDLKSGWSGKGAKELHYDVGEIFEIFKTTSAYNRPWDERLYWPEEMRTGEKGVQNQKQYQIEKAREDIFNLLKKNMIKWESGGNPYAVGPEVSKKRGSAFGLGQIMPENWPEWAKQAGLPDNAPMTPENQMKVIDHRLKVYLKKYNWNPALVAAAWGGGERGAANPLSEGITKPLLKPMGAGLKETLGQYMVKTASEASKVYNDVYVPLTGQKPNVVINQGEISVTVNAQTGASKEDIAQIVVEKVEKQNRDNAIRWSRSFGGSY